MFGWDQSPKTADDEQIQKQNSMQGDSKEKIKEPPNSGENEKGQDSEHRTGSNVSMSSWGSHVEL